MKRLLVELRTRLGDFWWYTLMIFLAMRAADLLNMFVGLYLVPKYVHPDELGAVMPLAQFANVLAVPAAVFATTFRQELTRLAGARAYGEMKSLMRGVFIASAVFFLIALVVSRLLLPNFLGRIRIAEGSLGFVILAAAFTTTIAPVYTNALQTLKKFTAYSWISVLCAPVRLVTMLLTMPFRALTGYFVGQGATPAFSIFATLFTLRKELAGPAKRYWTRAVASRFFRLFFIFGLSSAIGGVLTLVEATTIRQCLPAVDSAAYYMVTRFAEISCILSSTLLFTIFPFASELAEKGRDTRPLILKCAAALALFAMALALFFALFGKPILAILPQGEIFANYDWAIPVLVAIYAINQASSFYTTARTAEGRLGYMRWTLPLHAAYTIALYFAARHATIHSLGEMLVWMGGFQVIRFLCTALAMLKR